jgi:hypothetical protein
MRRQLFRGVMVGNRRACKTIFKLRKTALLPTEHGFGFYLNTSSIGELALRCSNFGV